MTDITGKVLVRHGWKLFAFVVLFMPFLLKAASDTGYVIKHFTNENGLAQNSIFDLTIDRNGFLWIATQGGISRYDGSRFKLYNSSNTDIPVDRVSWITLRENGLLSVQLSNLDANIYTFDNNYQLLYDSVLNKRKYFFFDRKYALVIIDSARIAQNNYSRQELASLLYDMQHAKQNVAVNEQQLYFRHDNKILFYDNRSGIIKECRGELASTSENIIVGDVFIGFDTLYNYMLIRDGTPLKSVPATATFNWLINYALKANTKKMFFRYGAGVTLAMIGNDVWLLKKENGLLQAALLFKQLVVEGAIYQMLYDDQNGNLYVGTATAGLYIVNKRKFETITLDGSDMSKNNIYSQVQTDSQTVLTQYFSYNPITGKSAPAKEKFHISALFKSSDGRIWYSDDEYIINCNEQMQDKVRIPFADRNHLNVVGCFLEDDGHKIWFCSQNAFGYIAANSIVYTIRPTAEFRKYKIGSLFQYDKHKIWIGYANGICIYDKTNNKLDTNSILPGNDVRSISRAKDGTLWVTTYGKGFYKFQNGRFMKMPLDKNKYLLFAHSINEDRSGFFWIPTNNGLFQCRREALNQYANDPENNAVYYFHYRDCGKYTNEFNGGSNPVSVFFKHLLLLQTINGIVSFAPDSMKPNLPNKNIVIEAVKADGTLIENKNGFVLSPGFNHFEITVSAPYIGEPVNNVLEYSLDKDRKEWYAVPTDGKIVYNRLPHGSYRLNIRKRTGFGVGDYAYHQLKFVVQPHWYQTWTFIIIALIILGGLLFYLVKLRVKVLERTKITLEKMVDERTAELNDMVQELNQSEQHLSKVNQVHEKAIAIILHDIQSPMHFLSTSAKYFKRQLKNMSAQEVDEYAVSLAQSTSEINNFTNDLLQWLIFNQDNQTLNNETTELAALFEDIKRLYDEVIKFKGNSIVLAVSSQQTIVTDKNKLKLVIRNLVDNANKNCQDGTITISAGYDSRVEKVIISVADTGKGMTKEELFALQNGQSENGHSFQNGKVGFKLVRDFLISIHGDMKIESEPGTGTTISILIDRK